MAGQNVTFDFLTRGVDSTAGGFRKVADNTVLAARGAKVLANAIETLGQKENRTSAESALLAKALRQTGDAEDRVAARAVIADAAIRRLDDAMQENARDAAEAAAANRLLGDSFDRLAEKAGGPSLKGALTALAPALIPLSGGIAAGVGAIGVSFGAAAVGAGLFGALAGSVFANVSKDNQKLQTAQKQLAAAQIARSQATTKAQRDAADKQIAAAQDTIAAIRSEGAAYNQVLDLSREIGTRWKVASAQIASPALVPWLSAVSKGIAFIRPLVQPVADQFRSWGQSVDRYFSSSAGSAEIRRLATSFGLFSADQLSALGVFLTDVGKAVFNLGRDLAGHNVDFGAFSVHLDQWGGAFLRWSQSGAARHDVSTFLAAIRTDGPATRDLLKNLGGVLAAFAPGLSSAGSLELRLVSDFLGFLARTPESIAKPLTEVAGALLLLQKTGVLKVGIKIAGPALKWLTGGVIDIGGGATAAAEIRAAMVSGGIAAGAEIRAAMAGGGAAAGAGTAAGGAGAGAAAGRAAGGGFLAGFSAAVGPVFAGVLGGLLIRAAGDTLSPSGTFAGRLNAQFQADGHAWSATLLHSFTFGGLEAWMTTHFGQPVGGFLNNTTGFLTGSWGKFTGFLSGSWDKTWRAITGTSSSGSKAVSDAFGAAGRAGDSLRTRNLVPLQGEFGKVTGGIQGLAGTIQGTMLNALRAAGARSDAIRTQNLVPLRGELGRVSGGVQGLQAQIDRLHGKTVTVGVAGTGSGGVVITTSGIAAAGQGNVRFHAATGGRVPGFGGGDIVPAWIKGGGPALLEPGEAVVDKVTTRAHAADLAAWGVPGFASGGFVGVESALGRVAGVAAGVEGRGAAAAMAAGVKAAIAKEKAAVSALSAVGPASGGGHVGWSPGAGVNQWRLTTLKALSQLGLPAGLVLDVLYQMMTESGGNPNIVNKWDSNWLAGHPSVGLMQVIRGTYATYSGPYRNTGPFSYGVSVNPLANIYAALNYGKHNGRGFGTGPGQIGSGRGYALGGLVGYASGGTVSRQGAAYLKAWKSRHGGGFGAAWAPATVNAQIDAANRALGRAATLAGASLPASQHKHYVAAAAWWRRHRDALVHERGVMRDWRGQLGGSDRAITGWIAAAGTSKALAPSVKRWKSQRAFQEKEISAISAMLGWSAAQQAAIARAHPPAKPPAPTGVLATHSYGGDVADNLGAVLAAALGPFTGAARGGMVMDQGGWLRPGFNPVWNKTGRPEQLVPARGGGGKLQIEWVGGNGGDDLERWIRKNVKIRGGGDVQRAYGSRLVE